MYNTTGLIFNRVEYKSLDTNIQILMSLYLLLESVGLKKPARCRKQKNVDWLPWQIFLVAVLGGDVYIPLAGEQATEYSALIQSC
jgi:hypothetical protein